MILKKFYGNTIAEARAEAKQVLGDGAVILETSAKASNSPASVTVMAKSKPVTVAPEPATMESSYSRSAMAVKKPVFADVMAQAQPFDEKELLEDHDSEPIEQPTLTRRGATLYPKRQTPTSDYTPPVNHDEAQNNSTELALLTERLTSLEKLIASSFMQSNAEYISHPAYQQLLRSGIPAGVIHSWFKGALEKGTDPFLDNENFMIELGAVIQRSLPKASVKQAKKYQVFMGSSGSGKTSLINKLSHNKQFLAGNKLGIISLNATNTPFQNPFLSEFKDQRRFEFFEAHTKTDMRLLAHSLADFDQVLIDTPSLSLQPDIAIQQINLLKPLLEELEEYELHHVVNTTLHRSYFNEEYINAYPIRPDFISLTHLDENLSYGHLLPLIRVSGCDIRYVGHGPSPFDDIRLYNQGWFTGKFLALEESK